MKQFLNKLLTNHAFIYKLLLYIASVSMIVYLFPKGTHFKYEFQKGKVWHHNDLYAPFDFAIQKSPEEINTERKEIERNAKQFFDYDASIAENSSKNALNQTQKLLDTTALSNFQKKKIAEKITQSIKKIYDRGFISNDEKQKSSHSIIHLKKGSVVNTLSVEKLLSKTDVKTIITKNTKLIANNDLRNAINYALLEEIEPNILFNQPLTKKILQQDLDRISYTKGLISTDERIISKGDIVEGQKFEKLESLKQEIESKIWSENSYYWITTGYIILVSLVLLMIFLFIKLLRIEIYEDNTKFTFIFFNIILFIFLSTIILKYNASYIYILPVVMLPLVLKAFFDTRLGLFVHMCTVLLIGFIAPNSFEFIFLHIVSGMVTILTTSELSKRANLFISVLQIMGVYFLAYFAFSLIQEGNIYELEWKNFLYFTFNSLATLFVLPLIYIYEKLFSLTSDESLKELSNTNSKLLRTLSEKAPGTFQHSLQVANLSEAAANEIGANAMLVRTGALYHDIGKMLNPLFFTENQSTSVNPHNELTPRDSAKMIIDHVIKGIELAKKNGLPDRIIDFIRTHHGTSLVYYFYKKEEELFGIADEKDFRYPGPTPFSKETAILMMCDSLEAASKSLREPSAQSIDNLVEKIIDKQMEEKQFMNANITFKELQQIKKVLKNKLKNIYHLRIEYPE